MVEGTAFRKIARLDPAKLKTANTAGVALLVETIGGSWGSTEIEERYEYFEKALYGTVQRSDESHDSFLARMETNFVELISRNTTLEEVQAYVLLRQSTLLADDKKRILLEHQGDLKYKPVVKAFRLLGSKFFNEFQSGKAASKTKVYDVNFTEENEPISAMSNVSEPASAFQASVDDADGEIDGEYLEALVAVKILMRCWWLASSPSLRSSCRMFLACVKRWPPTSRPGPNFLRKRRVAAFGRSKEAANLSLVRAVVVVVAKVNQPVIEKIYWRESPVHTAEHAVSLDTGKRNAPVVSSPNQANLPVPTWSPLLQFLNLLIKPSLRPKPLVRPLKCFPNLMQKSTFPKKVMIRMFLVFIDSPWLRCPIGLWISHVMSVLHPFVKMHW